VSVPELSYHVPSRFAATRSRQGGRGDSAALSITEVASAWVQVTARRNQQAALVATLEQCLGVALPEIGTSQATAAATVIGLQPASWLIQTSPTLAVGLLGDVARAQPGLASWVDHTHGRCLLRLSGMAVRSVLARLCRLDLHERVFAPGACAATLVGHVACLLRRVPQTDASFDVLVSVSYADWLLDELTTAAAACGWRFYPHTD